MYLSLAVLSVLFHAANKSVFFGLLVGSGVLSLDALRATLNRLLSAFYSVIGKIPCCCRADMCALIAVRTPFTHPVMSNTPAREKEGVGQPLLANPFFLASTLSLTVGILVDSEID